VTSIILGIVSSARIGWDRDRGLLNLVDPPWRIPVTAFVAFPPAWLTLLLLWMAIRTVTPCPRRQAAAKAFPTR